MKTWRQVRCLENVWNNSPTPSQHLSEKWHFMTFKNQRISAFKVESIRALVSKTLLDDVDGRCCSWNSTSVWFDFLKNRSKLVDQSLIFFAWVSLLLHENQEQHYPLFTGQYPWDTIQTLYSSYFCLGWSNICIAYLLITLLKMLLYS